MPAVAARGTLAVAALAALAATLAVAGCGDDDEGTTLRFVLRPQAQE
jgi:hypothetical protein